MSVAQTYDPRDVVVSVNSTIITGFAESSFVKCSKNTDNFTHHVGGQGEVSYTETADQTGTITIKINNTSPSYIFLNQLAQQRTTYPVSVADRNTGQTYGGSEARIKKPADFEGSKDITQAEFQIIVSDYSVD